MTPAELVRHAKQSGLKAVAVSDHDTADGVREARETGRQIGIEVIPAIELSAVSDTETHILGYFIDPDSPEFTPPGNIPQRVRDYCERTGQPVPESVGEVMRCIYESLAMKYRQTLDNLEACTGKSYPAIHVIGGGTKDTLLCQMTASSCARNVIAGPIEATVMGNVAVQLMSDNSVADISEARKIVANSSELKTYIPTDVDKWEEAYADFLKIVK